jgi:hypothetical protein
MKRTLDVLCNDHNHTGVGSAELKTLSGLRFSQDLKYCSKDEETKPQLDWGPRVADFIRARQKPMLRALLAAFPATVPEESPGFLSHGEVSFFVNPSPVEGMHQPAQSPAQYTHVDLKAGDSFTDPRKTQELQLAYAANPEGEAISPTDVNRHVLRHNHRWLRTEDEQRKLCDLLGLEHGTELPTSFEPLICNYGSVLAHPEQTEMVPCTLTDIEPGDVIITFGGEDHRGPATSGYRLVLFDVVSHPTLTDYYDSETQYTRLTLLHHLACSAWDQDKTEIACSIIATALWTVPQYSVKDQAPWLQFITDDAAAHEMYERQAEKRKNIHTVLSKDFARQIAMNYFTKTRSSQKQTDRKKAVVPQTPSHNTQKS